LPGDNAGDQGGSVAPINTWWLVGAAAMVLALFLLFAPAWRRRVLRRRRRGSGGPLIVIPRAGDAGPADGAAMLARANLVAEPSAVADARRDAHEAWAELLDTMTDFSVPIDEAETPRATADRLATLPGLTPAVRVPADLLASAEERARYARFPLRPDGLNDALAAARNGLSERATRWQRLGATLMPRSVVLRWRFAWVTWLSGTIRKAGRVREAMTVVSPRRLLARGAGR
jgi:hypothetical protein